MDALSEQISVDVGEQYRLSLMKAKFWDLKKSEKYLFAVVVLGRKRTYNPERHADIAGIVVKVGDLITSKKKYFRSIYARIKKAGGLHVFLNYYGLIILSPIMEDEKVSYFSARRYAKLIKTLKPDCYITPDGATYHGHKKLAKQQMAVALKGTRYLLKKCIGYRAVGLVKGSDLEQIREYVNILSYLGISVFVFHAGDFLSNGSKWELYEAKEFVRLISRMVPKLIVYGVGNEGHFLDFYAADGFVTHSHFAYKSDERIMHRLKTIRETLKNLERHPRIIRWIETNEIAVVERVAQD
jgi:hypothetical protein